MNYINDYIGEIYFKERKLQVSFYYSYPEKNLAIIMTFNQEIVSIGYQIIRFIGLSRKIS